MDIERINNLALAVLGALVMEWPAEAEPLPQRQGIVAGLPAWDCEQIIVAIENSFSHSGDVSTEVRDFQQAGATWGIRGVALAVWIIRCASTEQSINNRVILPAMDALTAEAEIIGRDGIAVQNVLMDAQRSGLLAGCNGLSFDQWQTQGPEGGFGGSVYRLRVSFI